MMMAVKPNPGITAGLAELGLTGTAESSVDGDAFTAILATLAGAAEGEGRAPSAPGAEDLAKQITTMMASVAAPAKPAGATGAATELATDQASTEDAPADETVADGTAVTTQALLAEASIATGQPLPAQTATPAVPRPMEGDTAPPVVSVVAEAVSNQATVPLSAPTAAAATPVSAAITSPTLTPVLGTEGETATPAPATAVPATAVVKAEAPIAPAAPAALQALLDAGAPGLVRAFASIAKPTAAATDLSAAPASRESKTPAAAGFLASTILPLLPESLHAAVLGQNVPAAAALAEAPQALDAGQQIIEQQLDLAHEGEWLDQLAKDIARSAGSEGALRFRLNPETLGSLHVEVTQGAAGASVRLTADTEAARAIIADAQPKLVAEARANGLKIAESHVDLGTGGQQPSGDPRRQADLEQQQRFVRTAAATEAEAPEIRRPATKSAERYA